MARSTHGLLHVRIGRVRVKAQRRSTSTLGKGRTLFFLHRRQDAARSSCQRRARFLRCIERVRRARYTSAAERSLLLLTALCAARRQIEFEARRRHRGDVDRGGRRGAMASVVAVERSWMRRVGRCRRGAGRASVAVTLRLALRRLCKDGRVGSTNLHGARLSRLTAFGHTAKVLMEKKWWIVGQDVRRGAALPSQAHSTASRESVDRGCVRLLQWKSARC